LTIVSAVERLAPVIQGTVELILNLKTAKAVG
jgi:hypothetical protein